MLEDSKNSPLGQTDMEDTIISSTASAETMSETISLAPGLWGTSYEIKPYQILAMCRFIHVRIRTDLLLESLQGNLKICANVCLCLNVSSLTCPRPRHLLGSCHITLVLCVQVTEFSWGGEIQFKRKY